MSDEEIDFPHSEFPVLVDYTITLDEAQAQRLIRESLAQAGYVIEHNSDVNFVLATEAHKSCAAIVRVLGSSPALSQDLAILAERSERMLPTLDKVILDE